MKGIMNSFFVMMLLCALLLNGCSGLVSNVEKENKAHKKSSILSSEVMKNDNGQDLNFSGLNDPALLEFTEEQIYQSVLENIDNEKYLVENIDVAYVSKEYLGELEFNSKENIFFGYTLSELNAQFEGTRYVFSVDDNGKTIVKEFEEYDDTYDQIIKNIAIGTGVVLVCVTVSAVTGGAGAPAVSMIFAASAKDAAIFAASSAAIGGTISGAVTYVQTGDKDEALKAAALEGSKEFKWGAITGAVTGGVGEAVKLKGATLSGLTMNEAATIQRKSKYPLEVIKSIKTMEEAEVYMNAGLKAEMINGRYALVRNDIDLAYKSELAGKMVTNIERMKEGYAAIDPVTGEAYQLHHIGQRTDSPLAMLTKAEHTGIENNAILHDTSIQNGQGVHSKLSDAEWSKQRKDFWKAIAEGLE